MEAAAATVHISTVCARLTDRLRQPEFEKDQDRLGLLTPSSGVASRAFDLIWVVNSQSMTVKGQKLPCLFFSHDFLVSLLFLD